MLDAVIARARAFVFVFAVCLTACSDSGGGDKVDSLADLGVDDGASRGESTSVTIKRGGEAILKLSTGAEVKIPRGAVEEDAELEIGLKRPPDSEALDLVKRLPANQKIASAPYVVTPHGTKFKLEVTVTLPVAKDRDPKKLKVAWLEDEKDTTWKKIAVPETVDKKATFTVDHFSVLMLVEDDEPFEDEQPGTNDAGMGDVDAAGPGGDRDGGDDAPDASDPGAGEVAAHVVVRVTPEDAVFEGILRLSVNGADWLIDSLEGSATFPRSAGENRYVVQVLQAPAGFTCTLSRDGDYSEAQLLQIEVNCTRGPTVRPTITVSVRDAQTGQPVDGALANVILPADWDATAVSGADGTLVLEVPTGARAVVRLDHPEYAPQYVEVPTQADERALRSAWFMNAHSLKETFDPTQAHVAYASPATVSIEADSLVDESGEPYTGLAVVRVTPIYARDDLANVPGELTTVVESAPRPLELLAALDVRFETPAGAPLSLAPEKSVTVHMPSAREYYEYPSEAFTLSSSENTPLYYYEPSTGRWVEEGSAAYSVEQYYEAELTRPGVWSAARVLETVLYQSCLLDYAGNPLVNALVEARGESYLGVTRARTDASGTFQLPVGMYASVRVMPRLPFEGPERRLSTGSEDYGTNACLLVPEPKLRITLTWAYDGSDLDLHFYGEGGHVYYANQRARFGGARVSLFGDVYGAGPELMVGDLLPEGRYRIVAHSYRWAFSSVAHARVRVQVADVDQEWVASGVTQEVNAWVVADLVVDGLGNVSVTPINLFVDQGSVTLGCPDMEASDPLACVTFECEDQSQSIPRAAYCNGYFDCGDGSDENNEDCPSSVVQCPNDPWSINGERLCDGFEDCSDGADEADCEGLLFDCGDGQQIKVARVCDEQRNCDNGADETSCGWPSFACGEGEQVPILFYCDGRTDCSDAADEQHCGYSD